MRVKTLTRSQAARLPAWHAHWHARMDLKTAPTDRARAEAAVARCYRRMGLGAPTFIWVESPTFDDKWATQVGSSLAHHSSLGWPSYPEAHPPSRSLLDDVRRRLGACDPRVPDVDGQIWGHVFAGFGEMAGLFAGVVTDPWDGWGSPTHAVRGYPSDLRAFACLRDVAGVRLASWLRELIEIWFEIAGSCGWWWPYRNLCILCERPAALHTDARGRLHNANGPAVLYRDGYSLHVWHGTRVPREWIDAPEALAPMLALTWPNAEQRRAAAEIIGWKRLLEEVQPRTIDRDPDPAIGELVEVIVPGGPARPARFGDLAEVIVPGGPARPARFLKVRCGTGRDFVLSVPPEMQTAREANAWTYGLEPDQYRLEART